MLTELLRHAPRTMHLVLIGRRDVKAPETVKAHLHNIYQKLNVSKRREAVEKARKIGIL